MYTCKDGKLNKHFFFFRKYKFSSAFSSNFLLTDVPPQSNSPPDNVFRADWARQTVVPRKALPPGDAALNSRIEGRKPRFPLYWISKKTIKKKFKKHNGVGASLSALAVATLVWEAGERKPTRLLVATLVWEPRAGGREATPLFQMTTRNEQGTRQPNRHNSKCRTRPDGRPGSKEEPLLRIGSHGKTPRKRKTARNK